MLQVLRTLNPNSTNPHEAKLIARVQGAVTPSPGRHPDNSPPVGLIAATEEDIASRSLFGRYHPDVVEFKQFPDPDSSKGGVFLSVFLYHYWDGTGVGYATDSWAKTVRWFRFGCTSAQHSIHRCPDCGHSAVIDSSD